MPDPNDQNSQDQPPVQPVFADPTQMGDTPGLPPTQPVADTTITSMKPVRGKFGPKGIIATVFGILLLVGSVVAGTILVQQNQDIREKAAENMCNVTQNCTTEQQWIDGWYSAQQPQNQGAVANQPELSNANNDVDPNTPGLQLRDQNTGALYNITDASTGQVVDSAAGNNNLAAVPVGVGSGSTPATTSGGGQICFPGTFNNAATDVEVKCDTACGQFGGYLCNSSGTAFLAGCSENLHACGAQPLAVECNCLSHTGVCAKSGTTCTDRGYGSNVTCDLTTNRCVGPTGRYFDGCGGPSNCNNCYVNPDGSRDCSVYESTSCGQKTECKQQTASPVPSTTTTTTQQAPPPGGGPTAQCLNIKAYDTSWVQLTAQQLSALSTGSVVRFASKGSATSGNFDRARFTVNGVLRPEVTTANPSDPQEFYDQYTIPAGITSFSIGAEIHSTALNDWY